MQNSALGNRYRSVYNAHYNAFYTEQGRWELLAYSSPRVSSVCESQGAIQSDDSSRRISHEKRIHARMQPPCLFDATRELIQARH